MSRRADERALWEAATEAVVALDADGRIDTASPSLSRVYGLSPEQLEGRPVGDLFHVDDHVTLQAYVARPDAADADQRLRLIVEGANGGVESDVYATPLERPYDTVLALSLRPAMDQARHDGDATAHALEQLRAIDEMKHRLLESVSHELHTPLTVISGFAETLQREDMALSPAQLRETGAAVQRQTDRLARLIADLTDLDRISRGALITDPEPVDLRPIVRDVVDAMAPRAPATRAELEPITVVVDRHRFERLVEDLLVNAHRHTPPGTQVTVRLLNREGSALLEVIDDGPGLPAHLLDDVFSPFVQGPTHSAATPGLGLGLALVRRYAELHGGRAWATSPPTGGTIFSVVLPAQPPTQPDSFELARILRSAASHETAAAAPELPRLRPDSLALITPLLRSVRHELDMQVAYLTLFDAEEQVVIAVDGDGEPLGIRPGSTAALEDSYCLRMVRGQIGSVVADARVHPELADLSATRAGVVAYAGTPLRLTNGNVIGSLCCADPRPHPSLSPNDTAMLRAIGQIIGDQLASRDLLADDRADVTERIEAILSRPQSLRTVYQPIVHLGSGEVAGVEAFARFPDSAVRPPDSWFADATRVGLGTQLDQLAFVRALDGLKHLPEHCYLSLNVTPATLVAGGLRPLLERLPLHRIIIEITEHAAVSDYDRLSTALHPFRAAGARLAIDDVGSGFANLRHVMRTRPDIIKMDRSLVSNVADDAIQRAIATSLANVAREMDGHVIAEGIEDPRTRDALIDAGLTHGQGWLFARPQALPLDRLHYTDP